jgi:ABC-type proline/glycine betaine transport system permease subunit
MRGPGAWWRLAGLQVAGLIAIPGLLAEVSDGWTPVIVGAGVAYEIALVALALATLRGARARQADD